MFVISNFEAAAGPTGGTRAAAPADGAEAAAGASPVAGQPPGVLPLQARVRVEGLQSEAGEALNGCEGSVASHDFAAGRVGVDLDGAGQKSIRAENLRLLSAPSAVLPTPHGQKSSMRGLPSTLPAPPMAAAPPEARGAARLPNTAAAPRIPAQRRSPGVSARPPVLSRAPGNSFRAFGGEPGSGPGSLLPMVSAGARGRGGPLACLAPQPAGPDRPGRGAAGRRPSSPGSGSGPGSGGGSGPGSDDSDSGPWENGKGYVAKVYLRLFECVCCFQT